MAGVDLFKDQSLSFRAAEGGLDGLTREMGKLWIGKKDLNSLMESGNNQTGRE